MAAVLAMVFTVPEQVMDRLADDEGFKGHEYYDSRGYSTIGYGTRLPLSQREGKVLLHMRLAPNVQEFAHRWPHYERMPEKIKVGLSLMVYQLGVQGVLGFHKMLRHLEVGNYCAAAEEALMSEWQTETPSRAREVAVLFREAARG